MSRRDAAPSPPEAELLARVRERAEARGLAAARRALREALAVAPERRDGLAWSRLAQEVGEPELALSELRRALAASPGATALREELAALEADLGPGEEVQPGEDDESFSPWAPVPADEGGAVARPRALPDAPPGFFGSHRTASTAPVRATAGDLVRFLHLFAGREDVHARQWHTHGRGSGYHPVPGPITPELLRQHLAGNLTLGAYLLRLDGTVAFFVLDLDLGKRAVERARRNASEAARLRALVHRAGLALRTELRERGVPALLADSGFKGRHAIGFLRQPLPAGEVATFVRRLAKELAPADSDLQLEPFPPSARPGPRGLGALVKLPLGVHRRTGRRAHLLDGEGRPAPDPWALLRDPPRLDAERLRDLSAALRDAGPPRRRDRSRSAPAPLPAVHNVSDVYAHDPAVALLLARCPVLAALVERALRVRRLSHEERVVLRHSLGQLEAGHPLLLALYARCPETPPAALDAGRSQGFPISCAKVRERVPEITRSVPCHCRFPEGAASYPTPLLHLGPHLGREAVEPAHGVEALSERCRSLGERQAQLEGELRAAQAHLERALAELRAPDGRKRPAVEEDER